MSLLLSAGCSPGAARAASVSRVRGTTPHQHTAAAAASVFSLQVARLEQRALAVSAECEALSAALDEARSAADGARSAAQSALEGLGQKPRERWPRAVLLVVAAAEAAVREEAAQKAVSAWQG